MINQILISKKGILLSLLLFFFSAHSVSAATQTTFTFHIPLHGIGTAGDNVNSNGIGNTNPLRKQRDLFISFSHSSGKTISRSGRLIYNSQTGVFDTVIAMGELAPGVYKLSVVVPGYRVRKIVDLLTFAGQSQLEFTAQGLIAGDMTEDARIDIDDYNLLRDCYSDTEPARNCADTVKKQAADLTDDGFVNHLDYNLFLREMSVQQDENDIIVIPHLEPTNTPVPPTATPTIRPTSTPIPPTATPRPTNTPTPRPTITPTPTPYGRVTFTPAPPTPTPASRILVSKWAPSSVGIGQTMQYAIAIHTSSSTIENIQMTDTLDSRLDFISAREVSGNGTCAISGRIVSCAVTAVNAAPSNVYITVRVNSTATSGSYIYNTASITSRGSSAVSDRVATSVYAY